jgi:zinc transport system substrate-binding protein
VAAELARLDPANAAAYTANAAAAKARIAEADTLTAQALAAAKDRPLIVYHDAYGYFADHFGLTFKPITGGDAAGPGAAGLRDLIAGAGGVACVFPEANHDAGMAEQVAADTGAKLGAPLDPEGSALTPGPDLYPALLTGLATTIADCVKP